MERREVVDDDGNIRQVVFRQRKSGLYYVIEKYSNDSGYNTSGDCETPEEAVSTFTETCINANCTQRFHDLDQEVREKVLSFIRQSFVRGIRGNIRIDNSYYLKHVVERGIGEYVGNGTLKGAMKELGFLPHSSCQPADINYTYALKKLPGA